MVATRNATSARSEAARKAAQTRKAAKAAAALAAAGNGAPSAPPAPPAPPVGPPDYANLPTAELLASFWNVVSSPLFDGAAALVNAQGGIVSGMVSGALAGIVSACVGLRKAYGRGIAADAVATDLGIVAPSGYNPTFGLYLQAARLRPDDAADRKSAADVKSAIRTKIRKVRSAK